MATFRKYANFMGPGSLWLLPCLGPKSRSSQPWSSFSYVCWGLRLDGVASLRLLFHLSNGDRAVTITMATTHLFNKYLSSSYHTPGTDDLLETRQMRALISWNLHSGGKNMACGVRGRGGGVGHLLGGAWRGLEGVPSFGFLLAMPSGFQALPEAPAPLTVPLTSSREASLCHSPTHCLFSPPPGRPPCVTATLTISCPLFQEGLPDTLPSLSLLTSFTSSREASLILQPHQLPLTPLGSSFRAFSCSQCGAFSLPFSMSALAPTTSRLPLIQHTTYQAQGVWTSPLPSVYLQTLL